MKIIQFFLNSWFLLICLVQLSCGGAEINIDRNNGIESAVNGISGSSDSASTYFTNSIFPLLIKDRSSATGGCAASGCHLKGNANSSASTFFQVNPSSVTESWDWAQVRRNRVISGTYASSTSSEALKTKKDANHNSFADWTDEEKSKIETWTNLVQ